MAPRIPVRFPWASRPTPMAASGLRSTLCIRPFSATAPSLALGPESPNYVQVPKPLQPTYTRTPEKKGHLPVPRDVFRTRSKLPKESEKFVARSTRDAKQAAPLGPYSKHADYRLYKQRLAESRKKAFREGVKELHERKTTAEARQLARLQRLSAEKRALAMAPPRTVDVLTQTTVSKSIRDFLEDKLPTTPREQIVQSRRKAYLRRMARQDAVRRDRLHHLYTNAREFIVTEEQLDDAVEEAFGTEESPVRWDNRGNTTPGSVGLSPWDGPMPEGVGDKLEKLKGGEGVGLAKERVKKVAEALTGGKM